MGCGCNTPGGGCGGVDTGDTGAKPHPAASNPDEPGCSGGESFALRVLGDDMAPEFNDGDIIIIEPDGALKDGCFVLARLQDEWLFRQLCRTDSGWALHALKADITPHDPYLQDRPLPDLAAVHGVVIQKAVPGRRNLSRSYL